MAGKGCRQRCRAVSWKDHSDRWDGTFRTRWMRRADYSGRTHAFNLPVVNSRLVSLCGNVEADADEWTSTNLKIGRCLECAALLKLKLKS